MLRVVVLSLATLLVGLLASRTEKSWTSPAAFFAVIWGGYLMSAFLFVTDAEQILGGMIWIWLSVVAMYAGTLLVRPWTNSVPPTTEAVANEGGTRALRLLSAGAVSIGAALVVVDVFARGFGVRDLVSFAALAQVSATNRAELYGGEVVTSLARRFCFIGMFLGTLYGGALFRMSSRTNDRLLALGTLFFVALVYTLSGSRMGVLYGGAFWLSSYLAVHTYYTAGRVNSGRFVLSIGAAAAVILIGLSTVTQIVRYAATQELDWYRMLADPFSFLAAFGIWFDLNGLQTADLMFGGRTFRRIYELVGIRFELQPAIDVGFTSSNIYTVFRDLIEDFGALGSLCAMLAFGALSRTAFAAAARRSANAVPWLALLYAFAVTSFASGMLSYTTPTAALILFAASFPVLKPLGDRAVAASSEAA